MESRRREEELGMIPPLMNLHRNLQKERAKGITRRGLHEQANAVVLSVRQDRTTGRENSRLNDHLVREVTKAVAVSRKKASVHGTGKRAIRFMATRKREN